MKVRRLSDYYINDGEDFENDYVVSYANADEEKVSEVFGRK